MHYFAKLVLHFTDFHDCRCGRVDFEPNRWILTCVTCLWSGCILNIAGFLPRWNPSSKLEFFNPRVRYGLAVGSCRVRLGWDYVLIWSSYSRVRGYCIVRCATPGLRSLRLFVVVWPSSLYLSCCLLFELPRWGVISIRSKSSFGCPRLICNLIRG